MFANQGALRRSTRPRSAPQPFWTSAGRLPRSRNDDDDIQDILAESLNFENSVPPSLRLREMQEAATSVERFDSSVEPPHDATDYVTRTWIVDPCIYGNCSPQPFSGLASVECLIARAKEEGKTHVSHPTTREVIDVNTKPIKVPDLVQPLYEAMKQTADTKLELEEARKQRDNAIRELADVKRERDEAMQAHEKALKEIDSLRRQLDEEGQHNEAPKRRNELESSRQKKRSFPFENRTLSPRKQPRNEVAVVSRGGTKRRHLTDGQVMEEEREQEETGKPTARDGGQKKVEALQNRKGKQQQRKNEQNWDKMFKRLIEYKELHGNCNVPRRYKTDSPLGDWVMTQRQRPKAIQRGEKQSTPEWESRVEQLEKLEFKWKLVKRDRSWDEFYTALVQYKKEHGNCDVPRDYENDRRLGKWVNNQRSLWKAIQIGKTQSKPEYESRFEKLEKHGFKWELVNRDRSWDDMFERLIKYKKEHGNCDVPRDYENDRRLGKWVHNQRSLWKAIQIGKTQSKPEYESRFEKLEKHGFKWELVNRDRSWDDMFERLIKYKKEHGNCDVPRDYENDRRLGKWVHNQRCLWKAIQRGKTQSKPKYKSRFEQLEKLGFNFQPGQARSL